MTFGRLRARIDHDEGGSALVLALVFLSIFGVFVSVILSFADTSFRATLAVREQASIHYGADGAIDGAINRLRLDVDAGGEDDDFTCFTPPALGGVTVTVRCQGQPGSGLSSGGTQNSSNTPRNALLSLAPLSSNEAGISNSSNGDLRVHGRVFSNSTITLRGGASTLTAEGRVTARGACDAGVTTTRPPLACNQGSGAIPSGDDPNYSPAVGSPPTVRQVPSCGASWLVQFQPGTYDDAVSLSNLMTGGCAGKVFWFQPGIYYFDFRRPSVSHKWSVQDQNLDLVAGTPAGWSTGAPTRPTIPTPGACDQEASGVQFIFGGDSRWDVAAGAVELCAEPSTTDQRIAVFGLDSGSASSTSVTRTPTTATSTTYTPSINALTINSSVATAVIPATAPGSSASITLDGYASIPAGSIINSATLSVAHQDTNSAVGAATSNVSSVQAIVTPSGGAATTASVPIRGSLGTDTVDLLAAGMSPSVDATGGFSIQYRVAAKRNKAVTSRLDGIELALTYGPPAFEAATGCLTSRPYDGNPGACALLRASGVHTQLFINGTIYAPLSAIDLTLVGASTQVLGRGVIAWVIRLDISPSSGYGGALVQIPDPTGVRADRQVLLTARVGGGDHIRALVTFDDDGGANPGSAVRVDSWSVGG